MENCIGDFLHRAASSTSRPADAASFPNCQLSVCASDSGPSFIYRNWKLSLLHISVTFADISSQGSVELGHTASWIFTADRSRSSEIGVSISTANTATTHQNSPPAACRTIANVHWPSLPKSHPCHKKKGQVLSPFWGPTNRQVLEENSPDFRDEE